MGQYYKFANIDKKEVLGQISEDFEKNISNLEDRTNLLEKNQNEQEEKINTIKNDFEQDVKQQIKNAEFCILNSAF